MHQQYTGYLQHINNAKSFVCHNTVFSQTTQKSWSGRKEDLQSALTISLPCFKQCMMHAMINGITKGLPMQGSLLLSVTQGYFLKMSYLNIIFCYVSNKIQSETLIKDVKLIYYLNLAAI